jgi:hypothetical protein
VASKAERDVWTHLARELVDDLTVGAVSYFDDGEFRWTAATRRAANRVLKKLVAHANEGNEVRRAR